MVTDAKRVESLAGLSAVRRLKPSSRASGRGQCSVLETSTAAESVVRRKGTRIALYLKPDRFDRLFARARESAMTQEHTPWSSNQVTLVHLRTGSPRGASEHG